MVSYSIVWDSDSSVLFSAQRNNSSNKNAKHIQSDLLLLMLVLGILSYYECFIGLFYQFLKVCDIAFICFVNCHELADKARPSFLFNCCYDIVNNLILH